MGTSLSITFLFLLTVFSAHSNAFHPYFTGDDSENQHHQELAAPPVKHHESSDAQVVEVEPNPFDFVGFTRRLLNNESPNEGPPVENPPEETPPPPPPRTKPPGKKPPGKKPPRRPNKPGKKPSRPKPSHGKKPPRVPKVEPHPPELVGTRRLLNHELPTEEGPPEKMPPPQMKEPPPQRTKKPGNKPNRPPRRLPCWPFCNPFKRRKPPPLLSEVALSEPKLPAVTLQEGKFL